MFSLKSRINSLQMLFASDQTATIDMVLCVFPTSPHDTTSATVMSSMYFQIRIHLQIIDHEQEQPRPELSDLR